LIKTDLILSDLFYHDMVKILNIIAILLTALEANSQTRDYKAKSDYMKGVENIGRKNYAEAISDFTRAIRRDTGFIQAYENRGVTKYYLNDYEGAISDYSKALAINPDDFNTHGRRGWAEFYLQRYSEAVADFTKAIEGNRNNYEYYNARGQSEYYLGDYLGAISDFTIVIKSGWEGEKYQKIAAYYFRGLAKIELAHKDSGCADLRKAAESRYPGAYEAVQEYCQ
jgi:tetratricopeptide (TPR) repeat protein